MKVDSDKDDKETYLPGSSLADTDRTGKKNGSATAPPIVEDADFDKLNFEGNDDYEDEIDFDVMENKLDQDVNGANKYYYNVTKV